MRLAEFKIKLLVYFAGKLLRWAGAPEQEPEWIWERAASSNAATSAPRTQDSPKRTPPEHWLRLTKKAPPEPWLDLLREKAPNLIRSLDAELPIQPEESEGSSALDQPPETVSIVVSRESDTSNVEILSQKTRVNPVKFANTRASSWLNRLRFASPRRRSVKGKAAYVPRPHPKQNSSRYVVANQPDKQPPIDILSFAEPSRTKVIEKESATPTANSSEREPASFAAVDSEPGGGRVNTARYLRTSQGFPESMLRIFPRRPRKKMRSSPAWIGKEGTFSKVLRAYRSLRYFEKRGDQLRESERDPRIAYQAQVERHVSVEEEAGVSTFDHSPKSRPTYPDLDLGRFQHPQPDIRKVNFAGQAARSSVSRTNYLATARPESLASEMQFRRPESSRPQVSSEPAYYRNGNVWPELPPSPLFELSDELVRLEAETEGLRRLEEEQRGTPCWNA